MSIAAYGIWGLLKAPQWPYAGFMRDRFSNIYWGKKHEKEITLHFALKPLKEKAAVSPRQHLNKEITMKLMAKVLCIIVVLMAANQAMANDDQDFVVNEIRTHIQMRHLKYDSKSGIVDVQISEYKYNRRIVLKDLLYTPKPDTRPEIPHLDVGITVP